MIDPTKSPAYCIRRVGCGLIFSYFISRREFIVAGKSFFYLVFNLVPGFMKLLTVARQELALHDPKHLL